MADSRFTDDDFVFSVFEFNVLTTKSLSAIVCPCVRVCLCARVVFLIII